MDYKQKYEQALEYMRTVYPTLNGAAKEDVEHYFPELKESEDERIREHLLRHFRNKTKEEWNGIPIKNIIAWLEKQKDYEDELEKAYKTADEVQYRKGYEDAKREFEKQGEQKPTCKLDTSYAHVIFPFKAKVKSTGKIVTIHDGQLSHDGKKWIKYQSDRKDGYKVYEPDSLELVCEIEQKPTWSEEDEKLYTWCASAIQTRYNDGLFTMDEYSETSLWLKSLKERYTWKPSDEQIQAIKEAACYSSVFSEKTINNLISLSKDLKKLKGE